MAKVLRPIVRSGGFYPSRKYTPLVYPGGYTTLNAKNGKPDPLNTISGSIVRFISNHVKPFVKTVVNIDPVQDLHGYDNPWPAGGGKNKLNPDDVTIIHSTASNQRAGIYFTTPGTWTVKANHKGSQSSVFISARVKDSGGNYGTATQIISNSALSDTVTYTIAEGDTLIIFNVTEGVSVNTTKTILTEWQVQLESGSTATAYVPYSNICPMSGWTGCEVTGTNKNIYGGTLLKDGVVDYIPDATVNDENKYVVFSAGATALIIDGGLAARLIQSGYEFKENTRYTIIFTLYKTAGTGSNLRVNYTDGTYDNIPQLSAATTKETVVFVTDAGKTVAKIIKYNSSGYTRIYYDESGIFEGVLTAADFVPYQGTTLPITFPDSAGTVYGGTLTVNEDGSGVLTNTHKATELGNYNWTARGVGSVNKVYSLGFGLASRSAYLTTDAIAEQYKYISFRSNIPTTAAQADDAQRGIYLQGTSSNHYGGNIVWVTDVNDTETSPSGLFVYELLTPITYNLTAEEVGGILTTLKGENNVWADTGDIEVTVYGVPIVEPQADTLTSLNILLGGAYRNNHTSEDVSDEEALNILLGGADR